MYSMRTLSALGLAALFSTASCKVQTGINAGGGTSGSPGAPAGGGGGGGGEAGGATCNNPQNHCLDPDDVMIGDSDFKNNYITVNVAKQQGQPNAAGETPFMVVSDGSQKNTKYAWKSHAMTDAEVQVGALAIALDTNDNSLYRAPRSREEATSTPWFLARIVSIDPLAQGYVLMSGGYKVARNALRAVDGDTSPRLTVGGAEDKWFVKPDHWLIGDSDLPASGYISVHLAAAIKAPSAQTGGEGQFLNLGSGEVVWTKYAWKQRAATQGDLKVGTHAIALDSNSNGVYAPPTAREQAYTTSWFIAKVVDVGQAYKGVVTLAGGYPTQIEGSRVIAK